MRLFPFRVSSEALPGSEMLGERRGHADGELISESRFPVQTLVKCQHSDMGIFSHALLIARLSPAEPFAYETSVPVASQCSLLWPGVRGQLPSHAGAVWGLSVRGGS